MKAIEELKTEHEAVKEALAILESIAGRTQEARRIQGAEDAGALLEFFATFVDRCHHGKEEGLLFPALEAAGISRTGGPIGVMLAEHDQGRGHVAGIRGALAAAGTDADGEAAAVEFVRHAAAYVELLRRHIDKEDNVLFAMAEKVLSEQMAQDLCEGFERIEAERIGQGRHEAFHAMLESLAARYAR